MAWLTTIRPRLPRGLAARVSALVLLVLFVTGASAFFVLRQLGSLQTSFDLLTEVYVVFNQRLAQAHVQAIRIGERVRTHQEKRGVAPEAPQPLEGPALATFNLALDERARLIREARVPIDFALRNTERFGGPGQLDDARAIAELLDELESLVAIDGVVDPVDVLRDDRTQAQLERRFQTLADRSRLATDELQAEVRTAQRRTERLTLAFALVAAVLGVVAAVGVFFTLRPLRRLTHGVRRLGRGDWTQRIALPRVPREDEVTQLAREFNLMADALQERERRLLRGERLAAAGQLAAQITHEIRNPLASVALNAELLEDELEGATPEAHRLLARISGEVDRLTLVTEEYLSFARRPKPQFAPVDLGFELRDLIDFLAEEFDQAGIHVQSSFPSHPLWVSGDANQLRQAFMNLLRNAREAVLDEKVRGRRPLIGLTALSRGGVAENDARVMVRVEDNGPGIELPEAAQERVFEAFYTSKAHGTGLGLPIVQQIVQDHGGGVRVAVTSELGTCFEVELPGCAPPPAPVSSPATRALPGDSSRSPAA